LSTSLLGAAAAGTRPQMILVVIVVVLVALYQGKASLTLSMLAAGVLVAGCLAWLLPMWYLQARLRPDVSAWLVYPKLAHEQWQWRLHRPHTFIGAGDWSLRYLGARFAEHILGWLGMGFGLIESPLTLLIGAALTFWGLGAYLFSSRDVHDTQFW